MTVQHVQHMQKALTQMSLQTQHVISDLTGTTGLVIVDAILTGERDPAVLAKLRDPRIQASMETIQKFLVGDTGYPSTCSCCGSRVCCTRPINRRSRSVISSGAGV
jgi:exo-beta-1,3-glucanase (GH17 family)